MSFYNINGIGAKIRIIFVESQNETNRQKSAAKMKIVVRKL